MSYDNQGGGNRQGQYESNTNYLQQGESKGGGYQGGGNGPYNNQGGGNKSYNRGGGGYSKFKRKEDDGPPELYKPYLVSGNRNPPVEILSLVDKIVRNIETMGYTVRVGGFEGMEEAAELAATKKEVLLPWKGFNEKESKLTYTLPRAKEIAKLYHKSYDSLSGPVQTFLAKNVRLVLGQELKGPALFAIIWSEDGAENNSEVTNNTGVISHTIAMLSELKVPVFNLGKPDAEQRLRNYLGVNSNEQQQPQPQQQPQQPHQQGSNPGHPPVQQGPAPEYIPAQQPSPEYVPTQQGGW